MINPNDFQLPQDPAEVPQESPVERMERWERESAAETQTAAIQGASKANAALDKMREFEDEAQQVHEENRNFYEEESKDIERDPFGVSMDNNRSPEARYEAANRALKGWGEKGEGFGSRVLKEKVPFLGDVWGASKSIQAGEAAQRIREGRPERNDFLIAAKHAQGLKLQGDLNAVEEFGIGMLDLAKFGGEFAVTRRAYKKPAAVASKAVMRATKGILPKMVRKPISKAAGFVAGSAALSAVNPQSAAKYAADEAFEPSRKILSMDDRRQIKREMENEPSFDYMEEFSKNLPKGLVKGGIDRGSEMAGPAIMGILGKSPLGKMAAKYGGDRVSGFINKRLGGSVREWWAKKYPAKAFGSAVKKMGYNGIFEEWLEERFGEVLGGMSQVTEATDVSEGVTGFGSTGDLPLGGWRAVRDGDPELFLSTVRSLLIEAAVITAIPVAGTVASLPGKISTERDKYLDGVGKTWAENNPEAADALIVDYMSESEGSPQGQVSRTQWKKAQESTKEAWGDEFDHFPNMRKGDRSRLVEMLMNGKLQASLEEENDRLDKLKGQHEELAEGVEDSEQGLPEDNVEQEEPELELVIADDGSTEGNVPDDIVNDGLDFEDQTVQEPLNEDYPPYRQDDSESGPESQVSTSDEIIPGIQEIVPDIADQPSQETDTPPADDPDSQAGASVPADLGTFRVGPAAPADASRPTFKPRVMAREQHGELVKFANPSSGKRPSRQKILEKYDEIMQTTPEEKKARRQQAFVLYGESEAGNWAGGQDKGTTVGVMAEDGSLVEQHGGSGRSSTPFKATDSEAEVANRIGTGVSSSKRDQATVDALDQLYPGASFKSGMANGFGREVKDNWSEPKEKKGFKKPAAVQEPLSDEEKKGFKKPADVQEPLNEDIPDNTVNDNEYSPDDVPDDMSSDNYSYEDVLDPKEEAKKEEAKKEEAKKEEAKKEEAKKEEAKKEKAKKEKAKREKAKKEKAKKEEAKKEEAKKEEAKKEKVKEWEAEREEAKKEEAKKEEAKKEEAKKEEAKKEEAKKGVDLSAAISGMNLTAAQKALWKSLEAVLNMQSRGMPRLFYYDTDLRTAGKVSFGNALGAYHSDTNTIHVTNVDFGSDVRFPDREKARAITLLHEAVHAATSHATFMRASEILGTDLESVMGPGRIPPQKSIDAYKRLEVISRHLDRRLTEINRPGVYDIEINTPNELIATAFTHPEVMKWLAEIQVPRTAEAESLRGLNLLEAFVDSIKDLLGLKGGAVSALEEVMGLSNTIMEGDISKESAAKKEAPKESATKESAAKKESEETSDKALGFFGGGDAARPSDHRGPDEVVGGSDGSYTGANAPTKESGERFRRSHTIQNPSSTIAEIAASILEFFKEAFRARQFIPVGIFDSKANRKKFASADDVIRRLQDISTRSLKKAEIIVRDITSSLAGPKQYSAFEEITVIENLTESMNLGELPRLGLTQETAGQYLKAMRKIAAENPNIAAAVEARKKAAMALVDEMVELGLLPSNIKDREHYYHQMVRQYYWMRVKGQREPGQGGSGNKLSTKKKSFQKKRVTGEGLMDMGQDFDYNTNFIEAEFAWMSSAIQTIETERAMRDLKRIYDVRPRSTGKAKTRNRLRILEKHSLDKEPNGKKIEARITALRKAVADSYEKEKEEGKITAEEKKLRAKNSREIRKLDPEAKFRTRIRRGLVKVAEHHPEFKKDKLDDSHDNEDSPDLKRLRDISNDKEDESSIAAKSVFKAIEERRKYREKTLNKDKNNSEFSTWKSIAEEDPNIEIWTPEPNNVFYQAHTVTEEIAEPLLADFIKEMKISKEDLSKVLAVAGVGGEMAIPSELASQLKMMTKTPETPTFIQKAGLGYSVVNRGVKEILLHFPTKIIGYFARNITGDFDIFFAATGPEGMKHIPSSVAEVFRYFHDQIGLGKSGELSSDMKDSLDLSVVGSSFAVQELSQVKNRDAFARLLKRPGPKKSFGRHIVESPVTAGKLAYKGVETYRELASLSSEAREAILRLAAYKYFLEKENKGTNSSHGASDAIVIDTIRSQLGKKAAAARMAREALGDYGSIVGFGKLLRAVPIPFWSFMEVNVRRYPYLVYNAFADPQSSKIQKAAAVVAVANRIIAVNVAFQVWNNFLSPFPEDEDDQADYDANNPHLLAGRTPDGQIMQLRNVGALGDLLEWFGGNDLIPDIVDWRNGRITTKELFWSKRWKAAFDKVTGGLNPLIKAPIEAAFGISMFPDALNPRPQSKIDAASGVVGLTRELRLVRSLLPGSEISVRPYNYLTWVGMGLSRPEDNAMSHIHSLRNNFLKSKGIDSSNPNSLSKWKNVGDAAKNEDQDAFMTARRRIIADQIKKDKLQDEGADAGESYGKAFDRFYMYVQRQDPLFARQGRAMEEEFIREYMGSDDRIKLEMARDRAGVLRHRLWTWWDVASRLEDTPQQRRVWRARVRKIREKLDETSRKVWKGTDREKKKTFLRNREDKRRLKQDLG